jgi:hypothetical protein
MRSWVSRLLRHFCNRLAQSVPGDARCCLSESVRVVPGVGLSRCDRCVSGMAAQRALESKAAARQAGSRVVAGMR